MQILTAALQNEGGDDEFTPYYNLLLAVIYRAQRDAVSANEKLAQEAASFLEDLHDDLTDALLIDTDARQYLGV